MAGVKIPAVGINSGAISINNHRPKQVPVNISKHVSLPGHATSTEWPRVEYLLSAGSIEGLGLINGLCRSLCAIRWAVWIRRTVSNQILDGYKPCGGSLEQTQTGFGTARDWRQSLNECVACADRQTGRQTEAHAEKRHSVIESVRYITRQTYCHTDSRAERLMTHSDRHSYMYTDREKHSQDIRTVI